DEDVAPRQGRGQGRVDRVAQGVHDGGHLVGDGPIELPDVGRGHHHIGGEAPVPVDATNLDVLANVGLAGPAVGAPAAGEVHLGGDGGAHGEALGVDPGAQGGQAPAELVAEDEGELEAGLGPGVPLVDVDVGAADGGGGHLDEDLPRTGMGHGPLHQ